MIKSFKKLFTDNRELSLVQENVESFVRPFFMIPFLDGVHLENISVSGTAADFNHNLNRTWKGFFVTNRAADLRVYSPSSTADKTLKITLQANTSGTVSVWVF